MSQARPARPGLSQPLQPRACAACLRWQPYSTGMYGPGLFFKSAVCSVLALGLDIGTRFGSGLCSSQPPSMGCSTLAGGMGTLAAAMIVLVLAAVATVYHGCQHPTAP
jgi:hypothetical protein